MRALLGLTVSLALLAGCSSPSFELGRADASDDVVLVEDTDDSDEDTRSEEDAYEPDTTTADSGTPVVDTGVRVDSGKADTYVKPDSYVPPMDSYVPPMDSYVPPMDSYVPPMDSYVPPMDSYVFDILEPPMDGANKCASVLCAMGYLCCPSTGSCYHSACLSCCM